MCSFFSTDNGMPGMDSIGTRPEDQVAVFLGSPHMFVPYPARERFHSSGRRTITASWMPSSYYRSSIIRCSIRHKLRPLPDPPPHRTSPSRLPDPNAYCHSRTQNAEQNSQNILPTETSSATTTITTVTLRCARRRSHSEYSRRFGLRYLGSSR